jgi:flagellar protein FliO/FliZ
MTGARALLNSGFSLLRSRSLVVGFAVAVAVASATAADENKIIFPKGTSDAAAPALPAAGAANSITLLIALVLAGVGGWLYLRNRGRTAAVRGTNALAVEETRSLGNRQYLVVASYEGKRFLLGVCPGRIDMLAPLGDRAEVEGTE